MQGQAPRRHLQLNVFDIFRRHRVKFKHGAIARKVKLFEMIGVVDAAAAREFVETRQTYDFVPKTRRHHFSPYGIQDMEIEFIRTAAHLALLPPRIIALIRAFFIGSVHVDKLMWQVPCQIEN
jgi:hypothetical protein